MVDLGREPAASSNLLALPAPLVPPPVGFPNVIQLAQPPQPVIMSQPPAYSSVVEGPHDVYSAQTAEQALPRFARPPPIETARTTSGMSTPVDEGGGDCDMGFGNEGDQVPQGEGAENHWEDSPPTVEWKLDVSTGG